MKDLNELWVGDKVKVVGEDEPGIFEGIADSGKALIKIGKKCFEIEAEYIDRLDEEPVNEKKIKILKAHNYDVHISFPREIDLHTEALDMNERNHKMTPVISKQIAVCKNYIQNAIDAGVDRVTVIHGKGIGALKSEVIMLLGKYPEVISIEDSNDGGATIVHFEY